MDIEREVKKLSGLDYFSDVEKRDAVNFGMVVKSARNFSQINGAHFSYLLAIRNAPSYNHQARKIIDNIFEYKRLENDRKTTGP